MDCLYRGCNVTSWRFIWLKIITEWTPIFHKFYEAQSIPTSVCLTGRLLTHGRNVFSRNYKIGPQRTWNISQTVMNLGKNFPRNLTGLVLKKKTHIFFCKIHFHFIRKRVWCWLVKIAAIFPLTFPGGPHVRAGWNLTNNNPYWSFYKQFPCVGFYSRVVLLPQPWRQLQKL